MPSRRPAHNPTPPASPLRALHASQHPSRRRVLRTSPSAPPRHRTCRCTRRRTCRHTCRRVSLHDSAPPSRPPTIRPPQPPPDFGPRTHLLYLSNTFLRPPNIRPPYPLPAPLATTVSPWRTLTRSFDLCRTPCISCLSPRPPPACRAPARTRRRARPRALCSPPCLPHASTPPTLPPHLAASPRKRALAVANTDAALLLAEPRVTTPLCLGAPCRHLPAPSSRSAAPRPLAHPPLPRPLALSPGSLGRRLTSSPLTCSLPARPCSRATAHEPRSARPRCYQSYPPPEIPPR